MADDTPLTTQAPPSAAEIARAIVAEAITHQNLEKFFTGQSNADLENRKQALELAWKILAWLPAHAAEFMFKALAGGEPQFDQIAQIAVGGLFGDGGAQHGAARGYTQTVSTKILEALTNGASSIEPNEDAARHFLDVATHLEIEGWLQGMIIELVSSFFPKGAPLEKFGELKDGIAHAMGLGRLSRRVFGPYVDTFITTPTKQSLNKKFQPHSMSAAQAAKHMFRGFIEFADFYEICTRDGLNERAIEQLQYETRKYFSVADVALLVENTNWTRAQGLQHLRESGLEGDQAELELQLQDVKSLRVFQEQSTAVAVEAFVAGSLDQAGLDRELAGSVVDPVKRDRQRFLALKRRDLRHKDLAHLQAEQAVELQVWSITDYRAWLDRQGYSHDAGITLELMLLAKLKKLDDTQKARTLAAAARAETKAAHLQALQAKRDALALVHADFSGSLGQAERLVVRGELTTGRYRRILIDHGLTDDDASALATLAGTAATDFAAAQEKRRQLAAKAGRQQLSIAALEQAVSRGRLSMADFRATLAARGFVDADVQLLAGVLADTIAHATAAEQARAAAAAKLATKHLSLGELESAVRNGVKTLDDYRTFLAAQGFSSADAATLVALLQTKIANDRRAQALHAAAVLQLEQSHLSLAQEETAVKDGLKTIVDYQLFLSTHGFTVDDVETLTELLKLKLGLP